jgi:hypothetical protein
MPNNVYFLADCHGNTNYGIPEYFNSKSDEYLKKLLEELSITKIYCEFIDRNNNIVNQNYSQYKTLVDKITTCSPNVQVIGIENEESTKALNSLSESKNEITKDFDGIERLNTLNESFVSLFQQNTNNNIGGSFVITGQAHLFDLKIFGISIVKSMQTKLKETQNSNKNYNINLINRNIIPNSEFKHFTKPEFIDIEKLNDNKFKTGTTIQETPRIPVDIFANEYQEEMARFGREISQQSKYLTQNTSKKNTNTVSH